MRRSPVRRVASILVVALVSYPGQALAAAADPSSAPATLTPDDRARFVEASRLLQAGDAPASYRAAKPLFDAYPDNQDIQDLRCQLATLRWLDKDGVAAECAASTRLAAAQSSTPNVGVADPSVAAPVVPPPVSPPAPAAPADSSAPPPAPEPTSPEPPAARFLVVAAGYGMSLAWQQGAGPGKGAGFYADVEYGVKETTWFVPKAYAGVLLTVADTSSCDLGTPCDVSAKIGFVGGKARLIAPIPYVAPYVEGGIGVSFGVLTTRTPGADNGTANIAYNVPLGLGIVFGKDQTIEVGLDYLLHPGAGQFDGAFALSLSFPLR